MSSLLETSGFALNLDSVRLTDEQFYRVCHDNPELRLELTADGRLIIMPPTGAKTGLRGSLLNQQLVNWAEADGAGLCFDSSSGFALPNGAKRSPDASWMIHERWSRLTEEQQEGFAPLCPDFVVELRSPTDSLVTLQKKMVEYIENGARLGWLLDPRTRRVYIYRPGREVEVKDNPATVSGEDVLPGFILNLAEIW